MDTHYVFPPAAAYPLNRLLFSLKSDPAFRERYVGDAERMMVEAGLDAHDARGAGGRSIATGWWRSARIRTSCSWPSCGWPWRVSRGPSKSSDSEA